MTAPEPGLALDPSGPAVPDRLATLLGRNAAYTLVGIAEALFPSDEDGPGALTSGALHYVASRLADDVALAAVYRAQLDLLAARTPAPGAPWSSWESMVADLMSEASAADVPLGLSGAPSAESLAEHAGDGRGFVLLVWQHVREGLFCDPRHGGNHDAVMWRWLGYPGVQLNGYTDAEVRGTERLHRPVRVAADWLRARG